MADLSGRFYEQRPIGQRPWVLPQYIAGCVPKFGLPKLLGGLFAGATAYYTYQLIESEKVAVPKTIPELLNLSESQCAAYYENTNSEENSTAAKLFAAWKLKLCPWWQNLKFGEDDGFLSALVLTPLSVRFMASRFNGSSTALPRSIMKVVFPLFVLRNLAPVFYQRFVPDCHPALKSYGQELEASFERPLRVLRAVAEMDTTIARLSTEHTFAIRQTLSSSSEDEETEPAVPSATFFPSPLSLEWEAPAVLCKAGRGARYLIDSLRIYSYWPNAVFSYHWVDGADVKYYDEYRSFLHARKNL